VHRFKSFSLTRGGGLLDGFPPAGEHFGFVFSDPAACSGIRGAIRLQGSLADEKYSDVCRIGFSGRAGWAQTMPVFLRPIENTLKRSIRGRANVPDIGGKGGKFCMVTVYLFEKFLHPIFQAWNSPNGGPGNVKRQWNNSMKAVR
jgi:hypothetical protein